MAPLSVKAGGVETPEGEENKDDSSINRSSSYEMVARESKKELVKNLENAVPNFSNVDTTEMVFSSSAVNPRQNSSSPPTAENNDNNRLNSSSVADSKQLEQLELLKQINEGVEEIKRLLTKSDLAGEIAENTMIDDLSLLSLLSGINSPSLRVTVRKLAQNERDRHHNSLTVSRIPYVRQSSRTAAKKRQESLSDEDQTDNEEIIEGNFLESHLFLPEGSHNQTTRIIEPGSRKEIQKINNTSPKYWQKIENNYKEQNQQMLSVLSGRKKIITSDGDQESEDPGQQDLITTLGEIQTIGEKVIDVINQKWLDSTKEALTDIKLAPEILDVVQKAQVLNLGCQSAFYIECAKTELAKAQNSISQVGEGDIIRSVKDAFIDFLYSEVLKDSSPRAAYDYSLKKAKMFSEKAENIKKKIINDKKALKKLSNPDQAQLLSAEIERMEIIHDALQKTARAYENLNNEAWIEIECGSLLKIKKSITEKIFSLQGGVKDPKLTEQLGSLLAIVEDLETDEKRENWVAKTPLEFLESVESLPEDADNKNVVSINGKIVLVEPEKQALAQFVQSTERKNLELLNTRSSLRSALMILGGSMSVRQFDDLFETQYTYSIPLTVANIKDFYGHITKKDNYQNSHFINPHTSEENVMQALERARSENPKKVIKFDENAMSFNPFKEEFSKIREPVDGKWEDQKKAAGRERIKHLIKSSLPPKEQAGFLDRFDAEFQRANDGVTVESVLNFMKSENELQRAKKNAEIYTYINKLKEGAACGIGSGAVAIILPHLILPQISLCLGLVIGTGVACSYMGFYVFKSLTAAQNK